MASFQPPTSNTTPPVSYDRGLDPLVWRLCAHMAARPAGRNVYILSNNLVTETDPDSRTVYWTSPEGSPYVTHAFFGGHDAETITDTESTLLTAAGYTVT